MTASPMDAAPVVEQRKRLVSQAMDHLAGLEHLPLEDQLLRLGQVQELLGAVLDDADVSQLGIPGVG